ncbi:hypothetical protein ACFLZZ_04115 [Nanoarchaeota archaeon]
MKSSTNFLIGGVLAAALLIPFKANAKDYVVRLDNTAQTIDEIEDYNGQLETTLSYNTSIDEKFNHEKEEFEFSTAITTSTALSKGELEKVIEKSIYHQSNCKAYTKGEIDIEKEIKWKTLDILDAILAKDFKRFFSHFHMPVYDPKEREKVLKFEETMMRKINNYDFSKADKKKVLDIRRVIYADRDMMEEPYKESSFYKPGEEKYGSAMPIKELNIGEDFFGLEFRRRDGELKVIIDDNYLPF